VIPLAHGVGARADLPLPVSYVVVGGGLAVLATFAALGLLWKQPRLRGGAAGRPLPVPLAAALDSRVLTAVLRLVVLALTLLVLAVAWFGPRQLPANLAPWALYVTFWVGLVFVSLLLGPVWARLNPLRTLYGGLSRLTGPAPFADRLPALGYFPAAALLLWFAWQELAAPSRAFPSRVALFLTLYAGLNLLGAMAFGNGWFARCDGFEVYSRLIGRLAPIGRRDDGTLVWRTPLDGAAGLRAERGLWAVVVVLVGSTAFDGVTRTLTWQDSDLALEGGARAETAGLFVSVVVVGLLYRAGAAVAGRAAGVSGTADRYAHSLVPIATGYAIAHYFSLFLLDGQTTWILASDPFDSGLDLFGTRGKVVDYTWLSPRVISLVQVAAIVVAHLVGLALAHDRALELDREGSRPHRPWVAQLPLAVLMVGLTSGGLALLLGT
jgi:hypothetical protein